MADEDLGALGNPLRVEDDEYEQVDEVELVAVARRDTVEEARSTARALVEHGLGATVSPAGEAFDVRVLPGEADRAAAVLGAPARAGAAEPGGEPPGTGRAPVPWRALIVIWVAAMVLIPLIAFLATYLIAR
jgi:hypothetical protein